MSSVCFCKCHEISIKQREKKFFSLVLLFLLPVFAYTVNVDSLLTAMTIEEKVGQMTLIDLPALHGDYSDLERYFIGAVLSGGDSNPEVNEAGAWANQTDTVQFRASKTRHSIPILYGIDAVHGHNNVGGATIFPHNIGIGAANDTALCRLIAQATAIEMLATGVYWTFAPCLAVPQDERWGRYYEGFSEDPLVVSELGYAYVKGFAGAGCNELQVLPCVKHWAGDGATDGGVDRGDATSDSSEFYREHIFPYRKSIEAGVGSVMASFSSWNTKPCHGNASLLNDVLRNDLGFTGFVVSDWAAIDLLPGDYYQDVVQSINAGIDMVMVPIEYKKFISTLLLAVRNNDVPLDRIDQACRRILIEKERLGLFRNAGPHRNLLDSVGCVSHRNLARRAVAQSCVVLKNEANALPLKRLPDTVHVIGSHADNVGLQCGGWTIGWQGASGPITKGVTLLEGLRNRFPQVVFTYSHFGEAIHSAQLVIVAVGEKPYAEWFGYDPELVLPPEMVIPLQNARASGATVVSVLYSGRPIDLSELLPFSDALIAAWLPGSEGDGVVDILAGDVLPSGRLSITWPRSVSSIPVNATGYENKQTLFPMGFGMGYPYENEEAYVKALLLAGGEELFLFRDSSWSPIDSVTAVFVDDSAVAIRRVSDKGLGKIIEFEKPICAATSIAVEYFSDGELFGTVAEVPRSEPISVPSMMQCTQFSWQKNAVINEVWDDRGVFCVSVPQDGVLYYIINVDVSSEYRILLRGKGRNTTVSVSVCGQDQTVVFEKNTWETKTLNLELPSGPTVLKLRVVDGHWEGNWVSFDTFLKKKK